MSVPKILSMVLCLRAVITEPWFTFAGVFTELLCREKSEVAFDAYIRMADVEPLRDQC